ncbi:hypothetical protein SLNWT_4349 [Streptomyces albus]|uniref:Uncharacterized protein n=1 Tax=Streptomyces albus (strain ATCC 21838 / DSM 41398 / FERM P-419 / JCM 4703 / NBRC 107858) TaxID=1081613 RepID=A0A0B5EZD6_STRA4|nr:hypothetical protein SLNWT_4349 [Streptomyces albus]
MRATREVDGAPGAGAARPEGRPMPSLTRSDLAAVGRHDLDSILQQVRIDRFANYLWL